jgi:hypothetical protein
MSRIERLLGYALLLPVVGLVPSSARAQCGLNARQFASIGQAKLGYEALRFDVLGAENQGNEIGRFWQSSNSNVNNFGGSCPSSVLGLGNWWHLSQAPRRGLQGYLSSPSCFATACPSGDLTVLVEELSDPSFASEAYFMALRVDATPSSLRYWDFSRLDRSPTSDLLTLRPFPRPRLVWMANFGEVEVRYPDIDRNVHSAQGPDDDPLPLTEIVESYQLYLFKGNADPGREVEKWTLLANVPYEPGGYATSFVSVCSLFDFPQQDAFLALGLSFDGGSGPDVPSRYVGSSFRVSCTGLEWEEQFWPAGAIPDGRWVPGTPLRIAKQPSRGGEGDITLSWGYSGCSEFDWTSEVYEGDLGDFTSHDAVDCSTQSPVTITPGAGDKYYLVVPQSYRYQWDDEFQVLMMVPSAEGSYGRRSNGEERERSFNPCAGQYIAGGC